MYGSRVGITLPPKLDDDNNWRGLVKCSRFSGDDQCLTTSPVKLFCHLGAKDYCSIAWILSPCVPSLKRNSSHCAHPGKFIWLTSIPRVLLTELNMVSDVEARIHINCPCLTADKCGIRLLYRHEDDEFNKVITHCRTSFFDNLSVIRQLVEADQNVRPCQQWTRRELPILQGHIMDFDRDLIYNATFRSKETKPLSCSDKNWIGLALCALHWEPLNFRGK